jgi:hypothetical protein
VADTEPEVSSTQPSARPDLNGSGVATDVNIHIYPTGRKVNKSGEEAAFEM